MTEQPEHPKFLPSGEEGASNDPGGITTGEPSAPTTGTNNEPDPLTTTPTGTTGKPCQMRIPGTRRNESTEPPSAKPPSSPARARFSDSPYRTARNTRKKTSPPRNPNLRKEPRQLLVWFPGAGGFVDCTGRTKYEKLAKEAERNARQKGSTKKEPSKPAPHWKRPSDYEQNPPSGNNGSNTPPQQAVNPADFDPLQASARNYRPRINGKTGCQRGWFEHMPKQASATKPREFYGLRPRNPRPGSYGKIEAARIPDNSRAELDAQTRENIRQAFASAVNAMFFGRRASIDHFVRMIKTMSLDAEHEQGRGFGTVQQWREGFPRVEIEIALELRPGVKEKVLALAVLDDKRQGLAPAKNVGFYMLNPETGRYVLFDGFRELSRKINGEEWAMWEDYFDEREEAGKEGSE